MSKIYCYNETELAIWNKNRQKFVKGFAKYTENLKYAIKWKRKECAEEFVLRHYISDVIKDKKEEEIIKMKVHYEATLN